MLFQVCEESRPTAEIVDELFEVQFSPEGSNKRQQEEAITSVLYVIVLVRGRHAPRSSVKS